MVQVCANGARTSGVPVTPGELAVSVAGAVGAGASDVHLHPKADSGADTLAPAAVAAAVSAVRRVAEVPVGVTTGAWAAEAARVEAVHAWTVLPDHASVNWHEDGAEELAAALLVRGVGVEAGLWSGTDGPERFAASPLRGRVLRVLAEVTEHDPVRAVAAAHELLTRISTDRPILLHGEEAGAWPVLDLAQRLGLATRIGLEDTLLLPDGRPAPDNAALVRAALRGR